MRQTKPWAWGIIIFILVVIYFWTAGDYYFFFQKTIKTSGKITHIDIIPSFWGKHDNQMVTVFYKIEDTFYSSKYRIDSRWPFQRVGNRVQIEYAVSNPTKCNIVGVYNYNYDTESDVRVFVHGVKEDFIEIKLQSGLFYIRENMLLKTDNITVIGEFQESDSLLILNPYFDYSQGKFNALNKLKIQLDSLDRASLRDAENRVFKEIFLKK
ncbi:MAG: hypothetical protein JXR34_01490 [Bacteroidales bacterium]|nr:hypothetical protein [Bacteroidales bacterium]